MASRFGFLVGEIGIFESLHASIGLQAIHIIGDIFRNEPVEKNAEHVALEVSAVNRVAEVFGGSPNGFEKFLLLLYACSHIVRNFD